MPHELLRSPLSPADLLLSLQCPFLLRVVDVDCWESELVRLDPGCLSMCAFFHGEEVAPVRTHLWFAQVPVVEMGTNVSLGPLS